MAKPRIVFFCTNCGVEHAKWQGQCNSCGEWNTLKEEVIHRTQKTTSASTSSRLDQQKPQAISIHEVPQDQTVRLPTKESEFDRVLGGGIVPGGVVLLGGQPGIGKSTLLLQIALQLAETVLYVSGEESLQQVKMRANRLQQKQNKKCILLADTQVERIIEQAKEVKPQWIIIDSVQTLQSVQVDSTPGSITQIRECTAMISNFAKSMNIAVTLIGHITKDGAIAGPKLLEHMVDCVLQFEGDRQHAYRLLRSKKNRFGSTDELGIYEMKAKGLRAVSNPSLMLLEQHTGDLSGSAIAASVEGIRPMMVEVQSLVSKAVYGTPQRSTTGFELNRLHMLLAVLEKRLGYFFTQQDVFLNIAGGFRISDPSLDLAVIASLISSYDDQSITREACFCGEVGLSGEVRPVGRIELRMVEAERMGFRQIFIPSQNYKQIQSKDFSIACHGISTVQELVSCVFPS